MGGSSGMIGRAVQGMPQGEANPYGSETVPVQSNPYSSRLSSNQNLNPYSQPSALNQQMMQRSAMQPSPYLAGLQNLYSMFNAPRQYAPMPQYRSPALNYRPDMAGAQENLRRVAPSVMEQQRLQAIEDARMAAEAEANRPAPVDYSGGG